MTGSDRFARHVRAQMSRWAPSSRVEDLTDNATRQELQSQAADYWRRSVNTYLGTSAYYDQKERLLEGLLKQLPRSRRALDFGCGDGRYTTLVAVYSDWVRGVDISQALIAQACQNAAEARISNVEFAIRVEGPTPASETSYDLVTAFGVTCCVIDEAEYNALLDELSDSCLENGYLILIDTVRFRSAKIVKYANGYIAHYRQLKDYRDSVTSRGFDLIHVEELPPPAIHWTRRVRSRRRSANMLFCFKRSRLEIRQLPSRS